MSYNNKCIGKDNANNPINSSSFITLIHSLQLIVFFCNQLNHEVFLYSIQIQFVKSSRFQMQTVLNRPAAM